MTWHVRSPVVGALLLGGLVWFASRLDGDAAGVFSRLAGSNTDSDITARSAYIHRRAPGDYEVIDPDRESMDRLPDLFVNHASDMLSALSFVQEERRGWVFPIHHSISRRVSLEPLSPLVRQTGEPSFTPGELEAAAAVFDGWLREQERNTPALVNLRDGERVDRIVVRNVALNAALVLLAMITLLSLAGMPRYVRVWVARRRLSRGVCGVCRYDLAGALATGGVVRCPECGAAWAAETSRDMTRLGLAP